MTRALPLVLAGLLLAACGAPAAGPASVRGGGFTAADVEPAVLDLATYERLSAEALREALAQGDAATVERFVTYADGADPQPAATRRIAQRALAAELGVAQKLPAALRAEVARVAAGRTRGQAVEAAAIAFPRDEGAHPTALTEWWYVNGHLEGGGLFDKRRYGYEFTLFKVGALLHWAHVAITDPKGRRFRYARQWIPNHEVAASRTRLDLKFGEHTLRAVDGGYALSTRFGEEALDLRISSKKPPLLIGGDGKIDMPEGKDSWYYSQTRLEVRGELTVGGERRPVKGLSWLDHQWGPFFVSGFLDRWDWFSLQFEDGTEYNLFAFRDRDGKPGARHVNRSAVDGAGSATTGFALERLAWWQSPLTKLHYTTKWKLDLPSAETVEVEALMQEQEVARTQPFLRDPLPNYWEGAMSALKRGPDGKAVPGVAYCEHFGFTAPGGPRSR